MGDKIMDRDQNFKFNPASITSILDQIRAERESGDLQKILDEHEISRIAEILNLEVSAKSWRGQYIITIKKKEKQ